MTKLRLKRTAAEDAEREKKRSRKSDKRERKKRRTDSSPLDPDDEQFGPQPSSSKHPNNDEDDLDSKLEEERFEEKLRDAMDDDAS